MKKLYIHIGPAKTGTSTIQRFSCLNYDDLLKQGILYPKCLLLDQYDGQHAFAKHYTDPKIYGAWIKDWPLDVLKAELEKEIACHEHDTLVLSSERFWCTDRFEELKDYFKDYDVYIIAILRRQDERLDSNYAQRSRARFTKGISPSEYANTKRPLFDYYNVLKQWADVFGHDRILVGTMEKHSQEKPILQIYTDFIGYEFNENTVDPGIVNPKFSRAALAYINKVPFAHLLLKDVLVPAMIDYSAKYNHDKEKKIHYFLSPKERIELVERYADSNAKVAKEFLNRPDGQLFYDPPPDPNEEWVEYKGLSFWEGVRITYYIFKRDIKGFWIFISNAEKRRRYIAMKKVRYSKYKG